MLGFLLFHIANFNSNRLEVQLSLHCIFIQDIKIGSLCKNLATIINAISNSNITKDILSNVMQTCDKLLDITSFWQTCIIKIQRLKWLKT